MGGERADVLVIGAGMARLAAVRELSRAGLSVIVLEARDRIGGRVWTVRDPLSPVPIELGAEFVHGRPPQIWNIIRGGALAACDAGGQPFCFRDGSLGPCEDIFAKIEPLFERMRKCGPEDQTFEQFLARCPVDEEAREAATGYIEGFNTARKERISVQSLLEDERASEAIGGERLFRILDGYDSVARWLSGGSALRLNTIVTGVRWKRGEVEALARSALGPELGEFRAARVIVTAPLGVLQAGSIRFDPEPVAALGAARKLEMGGALRVTLRFREIFWPEEMSFLHAHDPWFPTWWSTLPVRALGALARLCGTERTRVEALLEAWYLHDWQAEPFSRGAYSHVPVNELEARRTLAAPVEDTLYHGGEASEIEGHAATVHGAIASGRRAASQILAGPGGSRVH